MASYRGYSLLNFNVMKDIQTLRSEREIERRELEREKGKKSMKKGKLLNIIIYHYYCLSLLV